VKVPLLVPVQAVTTLGEIVPPMAGVSTVNDPLKVGTIHGPTVATV
jgi:hypothetical protein